MLRLSLLLLAFSSPAFPDEIAAPIPEIKSALSTEFSPEGNGFKAPSTIRVDEVIPPKGKSIVLTSGGRWKNPSNIDVCWINSSSYPAVSVDLMNWVSSEYKKAGIGFNWQGECKVYNQAQQIRVYIKPTYKWNTSSPWAGAGLSWLGPINQNLGGSDCPKGKSCTMNISFGNDTFDYPQTGHRQWLIDTTRATAVHEFGHALGLAHEQERNDAPICQDIRGTLPNKGDYLFVGAYDPKSIMNYCKSGGSISGLSDGDIIGLRTLYPNAGTSTPPATLQPVGSWTIRSRQTNQCLEIPGNSRLDRSPVKQAPCNNSPAQSFFVQKSGVADFQIVHTESGLCLDVTAGSIASGSRIQTFKCNGSFAQGFAFVDRGGGWVSINHPASKKIWDLNVSGNYLQIWDDSGKTSSVFGFFPVLSSSAGQIPQTISR